MVKWYFVTKIVLTYCEKKLLISDGEKLLKFKAEGQEFSKILRSLKMALCQDTGGFLHCQNKYSKSLS